MRKVTRIKAKPQSLKPPKRPAPDLVREALLTALERCWDGHLPFRELEKAIALHSGKVLT